MDERSSTIKIGNKQYELLLTTKATREIAKKYGGLTNLGDKLIKSESPEDALGEVIWLIVLLANQPILIHNRQDKEHPEELLTEDDVELLTTPTDIADFKDAITECLYKGTKRNIESEDSKNAVGE